MTDIESESKLYFSGSQKRETWFCKKLMTKETKKDANESFRDSFNGKNYWIKKLKPKYEHFSRACFLFIRLRYKKPGLIVQKWHLLQSQHRIGVASSQTIQAGTQCKSSCDSFCNRLLTCWWVSADRMAAKRNPGRSFLLHNFHLISNDFLDVTLRMEKSIFL